MYCTAGIVYPVIGAAAFVFKIGDKDMDPMEAGLYYCKNL